MALDIIEFGEEDDEKHEKLQALLTAVDNNDNSDIVHVPACQNALSDVLISTPIFTGDGEGVSRFAAAAAAGGVAGFDFDVDPNVDPELAFALRVWMEEERARREAAAKKAAEETSKQGKVEGQSSQDATMTDRAVFSDSDARNKSTDLTDEEDALLKQALAMSMDDDTTVPADDTDMAEAAANEDLALALQMSVQDSAANEEDMRTLLTDQSFVSAVLSSLPGVDPNDHSIKDLRASMQSRSETEQKKNDDSTSKGGEDMQ